MTADVSKPDDSFVSFVVLAMLSKDMAEMYVGDDVSPDFYGWVFPKYDHVGVGTGTVVNRPAIKDYQVLDRLYSVVVPTGTILSRARSTAVWTVFLRML